MCRALTYVALLGGALILPTSLSYAGEWNSEYSVKANTQYNSNPTLVASGAETIYRLTVEPQVVFEYEEATRKFFSDISLKRVEANQKTFESTGYNAEVGVEGESYASTYVVSASLKREDTIDSSFEDGETIDQEVTRDQYGIEGELSLDLMETLSARISESFRVSEYSGGSFTDSSQNSLDFNLDWDVTDRMTFTPGASYDHYRPNSSDDPVNTFHLTIGGSYELSDASTVSINAGGYASDGDLGWSLGVEGAHDFDLLKIQESFSHDIAPTGRGDFRVSDKATIAASMEIDDGLSSDLSLSASQSKVSGQAGAKRTRNAEFKSGLNWEFAESWVSGLTYGLKGIRRPGEGKTIQDHAVMIMLTYQH